MPLSKRRTRYEDDFTSFIREVKALREEENFFLYGHCSDPDCPFEEVIGFRYLHQIEDADAEMDQIFKNDHDPNCKGELITGQQPYSNEEMNRRMKTLHIV